MIQKHWATMDADEVVHRSRQQGQVLNVRRSDRVLRSICGRARSLTANIMPEMLQNQGAQEHVVKPTA
jgi:hypothetical protein